MFSKLGNFKRTNSKNNLIEKPEEERDPTRRYSFYDLTDKTSESDSRLENFKNMLTDRHLMSQKEIFDKFRQVNGDLDILKSVDIDSATNLWRD